MALNTLSVTHIRNLQFVQLQDFGQFNVFYGRNGSGKTSLLESIHLLGMARSFRGTSVKPLITHGEQSCIVFGKFRAVMPTGVSEVGVGMQRSLSGDVQIKLAGEVVRKVATLAEKFPLQVITADSFDLLTGPPQGRRQYLDWGVFHVEHRFYAEWQCFQRCIKQRNKLLRHGKMADHELTVWTRDLASSGALINEYRQTYLELLTPRFKELMRSLAPGLGELQLTFRQGWDRQLSFHEALEKGVSIDLEQGYTHCGPQRADIRVTHDGHLAADTLSRGQQKLVVCGLKLAQGQLMREIGRGNCTYLIDDLPSELDREHSRLVCELLASMDTQVFLTCVQRKDIADVWPESDRLMMFHVEHGTVTRHSEPQ
jgi:DNA replication and repair protein RecF